MKHFRVETACSSCSSLLWIHGLPLSSPDFHVGWTEDFVLSCSLCVSPVMDWCGACLSPCDSWETCSPELKAGMCVKHSATLAFQFQQKLPTSPGCYLAHEESKFNHLILVLVFVRFLLPAVFSLYLPLSQNCQNARSAYQGFFPHVYSHLQQVSKIFGQPAHSSPPFPSQNIIEFSKMLFLRKLFNLAFTAL